MASAISLDMYPLRRNELKPVQLVEPIAEIEIVPAVRHLGRDALRIPILIRDAAVNGLLVVVSKEDGWLWKEPNEMALRCRRNTPIKFHFRCYSVDGKVVWCEGGQAGLRLSFVDNTVRESFESWIEQLSRNLIFSR